MDKFLFLYNIFEYEKPEVKRSKSQGVCCFCNIRDGTIDLKNSVSSNFTNYDVLGDSPFCCDICYSVTKDRRYRVSSWIANKSGVNFFKRENIEDVLFSKKEPPFLCYITTSFKKNRS